MGGELKPCPFCGNDYIKVDSMRFGMQAWCPECLAHGPTTQVAPGGTAQSAWNDLRAAEDDLRTRAEAAEAQAKQSAEAHDFLAHQVGAAAIAATLAPGESLAHKPGETPLFIVGVVERLVARTHAAEATAARLNAANVRLMRRLAVALGVWRGSADSLAAMGRRVEAAEAALAQAHADRTLMTGLWLATAPPDVLPALLPADPGDRDRLAAALDAVDLQASAGSHTAAGRSVIARIVAAAGGAR